MMLRRTIARSHARSMARIPHWRTWDCFAGIETVSQAMQDRELSLRSVALMTEEILPNVVAPRGLDLHQYIDTILNRFRNPEIRHPLATDRLGRLAEAVVSPFSATIADSITVGRLIDRLRDSGGRVDAFRTHHGRGTDPRR